MTNLVKIETVNGMNVVSSRDIAEGLGKRHSHVLESLEKILENSSAEISAQFIKSHYKDISGKLNKEYLLTKDGFILYMFNIQGYQEFKLAYINKFNEMERALQNQYYIPQNYSEALKLAYEQQEQIQLLNNKIESDKHRVSFAETIEKSSDCILIREFSKLLANEHIYIGEKKLYQRLREWGYILQNSTEPTQRAVQQGLFKINERLISTVKGDMLVRTTLITGKGQLFLLDKFKKEN